MTAGRELTTPHYGEPSPRPDSPSVDLIAPGVVPEVSQLGQLLKTALTGLSAVSSYVESENQLNKAKLSIAAHEAELQARQAKAVQDKTAGDFRLALETQGWSQSWEDSLLSSSLSSQDKGQLVSIGKTRQQQDITRMQEAATIDTATLTNNENARIQTEIGNAALKAIQDGASASDTIMTKIGILDNNLLNLDNVFTLTGNPLIDPTIEKSKSSLRESLLIQRSTLASQLSGAVTDEYRLQLEQAATEAIQSGNVLTMINTHSALTDIRTVDTSQYQGNLTQAIQSRLLNDIRDGSQPDSVFASLGQQLAQMSDRTDGPSVFDRLGIDPQAMENAYQEQVGSRIYNGALSVKGRITEAAINPDTQSRTLQLNNASRALDTWSKGLSKQVRITKEDRIKIDNTIAGMREDIEKARSTGASVDSFFKFDPNAVYSVDSKSDIEQAFIKQFNLGMGADSVLGYVDHFRSKFNSAPTGLLTHLDSVIKDRSSPIDSKVRALESVSRMTQLYGSFWMQDKSPDATYSAQQYIMLKDGQGLSPENAVQTLLGKESTLSPNQQAANNKLYRSLDDKAITEIIDSHISKVTAAGKTGMFDFTPVLQQDIALKQLFRENLAVAFDLYQNDPNKAAQVAWDYMVKANNIQFFQDKNEVQQYLMDPWNVVTKPGESIQSLMDRYQTDDPFTAILNHSAFNNVDEFKVVAQKLFPEDRIINTFVDWTDTSNMTPDGRAGLGLPVYVEFEHKGTIPLFYIGTSGVSSPQFDRNKIKDALLSIRNNPVVPADYAQYLKSIKTDPNLNPFGTAMTKEEFEAYQEQRMK